jgi:hypothetical protein
MAASGLRTLAICYKKDTGLLNGYNGPSHKVKLKKKIN